MIRSKHGDGATLGPVFAPKACQYKSRRADKATALESRADRGSARLTASTQPPRTVSVEFSQLNQSLARHERFWTDQIRFRL